MILNQILLTNSVGKYMEISVENLCVDIGDLKGYLNCQSGVRMRKKAENYFEGVYSTTDLNLNFGSQAHLKYSENPIIWTHHYYRQ